MEKKKKKNYLLTFDYYDRSGEDSTVLRTLKKPFSAKNDKEAKNIAKIHLNLYRTEILQLQNSRLEEIRIVAEGKELLNNPQNLKRIFDDAMKKQGFKSIPVGPAPLEKM